MLFEMMLNDKTSYTFSIIGIAIGIIHSILPMQSINEKLFYLADLESIEKKYDVAKFDF